MKITDGILRRYLEVCDEIKQLELEKNVIYDSLKEEGCSFETKFFNVTISPFERYYVTSVNGLIEKFGKKALGKLLAKTDSKRIIVKPKTKQEAI